MRVKMLIFLIVVILSTWLIGCSNASLLKNKNDGTLKNTATNEAYSNTPPAKAVVKEEDKIIPTNTSEPFIGHMNLDSETEKFFYGTWKVEKLLGFANSYNDASEYPKGQKIIGDEIIIKKNFFSSKGLQNYNIYQYELKDPLYDITAICYNLDSFYRLFKIKLPDLNINDEVKQLEVSNSSTKLSIPGSFFIVNNDRLILMLEATCFELKKVTD